MRRSIRDLPRLWRVISGLLLSACLSAGCSYLAMVDFTETVDLIFDKKGYDTRDPGANYHDIEYNENLKTWKGAPIGELIKSWENFDAKHIVHDEGLPWHLRTKKDNPGKVSYVWIREKTLSRNERCVDDSFRNANRNDACSEDKDFGGICVTEVHVDPDGIITGVLGGFTNCGSFYPYPARPSTTKKSGSAGVKPSS